MHATFMFAVFWWCVVVLCFFPICLHQFGLAVNSFICRIRKQVLFSGSAVFMSWHVRPKEIEKYKLKSNKEIFVYTLRQSYRSQRACCIFFVTEMKEFIRQLSCKGGKQKDRLRAEAKYSCVRERWLWKGYVVLKALQKSAHTNEKSGLCS